MHKINKRRKRAMNMHYSVLLTYIKSKDYWQQLISSLPVESSLFCPVLFALLVFQTHMISVL